MRIDPEKLIQARAAKAMSQEEAAIATDLSTRTIQRIEAGQPASLESTKALLTVFGADIIHDPDRPAVSDHVSPWRQVAADIGWTARRSASWSFDGLRFLFVLNFVLVALIKPFLPQQTGLFVGDSGFLIGVLAERPVAAEEVLGYWISPLMLMAALILLASIGRVRQHLTRA